ncbi:hypothetical protein N657DRAFT_573048 [Parathielavia appendiculata]|uniref:Uncharacterized protein n=1 Tax=Parathielavia appendiculata TaxID=2587402 RepID=A0AAN6TZP2_9PEZI|nr:hypothetical protein N657DRAFT_573048 [Parathielavia appendiculata]
MTSSSFAAHSRAYTSTQPQPTLEAHENSGTSGNRALGSNNNNNPSFSTDDSIFDAHRRSHNSSKLPAFRFADLRKDRISLPSLQQPTPLAPILSRPLGSSEQLHHHSSAQTLTDRSASIETKQTGGVTRSRSLKFHFPTTASNHSPSGSKRPASFPEPVKDTDGASAAQSQVSSVPAPAIKRRLTESAVKEPVPARRDLLLPKTVESSTSESDDKKSRPPLSYKLPSPSSTASASRGRAVIPPIRSFRSSGSRKSAVLDMPSRRTSQDSCNEEQLDANQRNRALRALEGQREEDFSHLAPSESGEMTTTTDNDNTADIFMRIAKEDAASRAPQTQAAAPEPSVISRIVRAGHRRPLSAAIPAHDTPSPPRMSRRLSDQRENSRTRHAAESQPAQQEPRESAYRTSERETLPPIATTNESSTRAQAGRAPQRPSPITPKQISFKESFAESSSAYQRRRQSLTENNNLSSSRTAQHRSSHLAIAQARTYHSSPLVPRSANVVADGVHHPSEAHHGVEGTESSSSTAAPSTVWDELDDLKSRIHRLELTGKLPSTSASRSSDERPRTATTNATTVSASPKRASGTGPAHADGNNAAVVPRETQPLLLSALSKAKDLVSPEVFNAIESAATDAMALSSMIGAVGQPGPISSGASTIGGYNGSVTDRQLRKKADSICRSLTELCIALADPTEQKRQPQSVTAAPEPEQLLSPTSVNATAGGALTPQRRPSAVADVVAKTSTSPRAPTSLEQKRRTMLAGTPLPSSRYVTAPSTPLEPTPGRKSSLLLARIRRTATEEPEEVPQAGRRSSLLLRSRRSGTEEPEEDREGRKTSLLLRTRKAVNEEEDELRSRIPSRALTELNSFRAVPRDPAMAARPAQPPAQDNVVASPLLPRRRILPSGIASRLATSVPTTSAPTTPARKYLERSMLQDRGTPQERGSYLERSYHSERGAAHNLSERLAEERGQQQQRQISLSQSAMLSRTGSLGRRSRETGIPNIRS